VLGVLAMALVIASGLVSGWFLVAAIPVTCLAVVVGPFVRWST
jgi:hypothetical protein